MLPRNLKPKLPHFGLLFAAFLLPFSGLSQGIEFDTLQGLLNRGTSAFSQGNFSEAAAAFEKIETIYSDEPEWKSGLLPEKLLPLSGYAAYKSTQFALSAHHFELFLDKHASDPSQKEFASFGRALALIEAGDSSAAIQQLQSFRETTQSPEQKTVAATHHARLLLEKGSILEAAKLLQETLVIAPKGRAKTQVALLLIRNYIESANFTGAAEILLNHDWSEESMPERALLSFAAIEIGDHLLSEDHARKALLVYRHAQDKDTLISLQERSIKNVRLRFQTKRKTLKMTANIWEDFYGRILQNSERQLESLRAMPDYSGSLALRKGHAYLQENRNHEAWLIFERLSESEDKKISSLAFKYWIQSARNLKRIDEAILIAKAHLDTHPESDEAASTLFELGATLSEQNRHAEAIDLFTTIIDSPEHPNLHPTSLFQRGLIHIHLQQYPFARADFKTITQEHPRSHLSSNAKTWSALSYFLEGSFAQSLNHFTQLYQETESPNIRAEALYRIACCHFAMGNTHACKEKADAYLKQFDGYIRTDETNLLIGDCLTQEQAFENAIEQYQKIGQDAAETYFHATIQRAHAYTAWEKPEQAIALLQNTLPQWKTANAAIESRNLLAQLHLSTKAESQAIQTITDCLDLLGNSPNAEMLLSSIQILQNTPNYSGFLDARLQQLNPESKTEQSRLRLAQALHLERIGKSYQAEALLLSLGNDIAVEKIPTESLAHAGLQLVRIHSARGAEMLTELVRYNPNSRYIDFAFYGLALLSQRNGEKAIEQAWLSRIRQASPEFPFFQESQLAKAMAFSKNGEYENAQKSFEILLKNRATSSSHKALALQGLARCQTQQKQFAKAIAYYQRIYTLYPALDDLVADSYAQSAELFQKIGEPDKAFKTCQEFLGQSRFDEHALRKRVQQTLEESKPVAVQEASS